MNSTDTIVNSLLSHTNTNDGQLPPVEDWNPPYCGEIDITIKSDGQWLHNKTPIGRKRLFKLFSTILLRQRDDYFLVTPAEKVKMEVCWQPFVIIDFDIIKEAGQSCYLFTDQCDNQVLLNADDQLKFSKFEEQSLPIINIRRNLYASFSRSCYYRLIDQADVVAKGNVQQIQIQSAGQSFILGTIED
ncbi:MAG: DUF1285 domain-containing protein [Kangiellaceae bacterium]|nr:DUF1285 domain-containing protein [Kangiellaceae bacterium]